jgi:hypothetical protein
MAAHRVEHSVYYLRMEREAFLILNAFRHGHTIADAIDAGFADSKILASRHAARLQKWFNQWAELGWICAREEV